MLEILVILLVVIVNIILALFIFLKNPKSDTHKYSIFFILVITCWTFTNYFSLHAPTEEMTLFWIKIVMAITSFLGPSIYLLVKVFPERKIKLPKRTKFLISFLASASMFTALSPYMFTSVRIIAGNIQPTPGPGIIIFAINFFGFTIAAFINLILKYLRAQGLQKTQLKYLVAGIVLTFVLQALTNFIFVVLLKISAFVILGPVFNLIFVAFVTYAIVKHRFLDITLVAIRAIFYILLILFIMSFYSVSLFLIQNQILKQEVNSTYLYLSAFLSLIIAFSYQPIKAFIELITDKILYQKTYDPQLFQSKIGKAMSATLELDKLTSDCLNIIKQDIKPLGAAIVLVKDEKVTNFFGFGYRPFDRIERGELYNDSYYKFKKTLYSTKQNIIVFEELGECDTKTAMRLLDIAIVLPLIIEDQYIGGVILKQKASGSIYSSTDIRLFQTLAPQFSVAIRNALSYEEIRNFNITLREKIRQATAKLRHVNQRLVEIDALKDEFVSVASHELRTPMTAIKNYLWLALNNPPKPLPNEVKKQINIAYNSTERLIHLVNDMLTISRIEGHRIELQKEIFNINDLILDTFNELKPIADIKNISFNFIKKKDPLKTKGDRSKLREVFQNIIGNALKFTQHGSVSITSSTQSGEIMISITDTGPGILKEDMKKIFTKFSRLEHSYAKTKESGTGLGLYISKEIVELHRGKIRVESAVNKGSTFYIFLPKY